jgi:MoaA/NifB/PqqE/SkfB family radical SAM enzyme
MPVRALVAKGFVGKRFGGSQLTSMAFDDVAFRVADRWVKWIEESPDLIVLFNTAGMAQNNPLLILGPYGALCWRGVVGGWTVGRIRREACRIFGTDEAAPFLARLRKLGFIVGDAALPENNESGAVPKEFPAPNIQHRIVMSRVPWYCLWELCRVCDLRCNVCYQPDFAHPGLSPAETAEVAQSLVDSGVFYVSLFGGESLLRRDLEEIIGQLRAGGVFVKIITNGQRLTPQRARALAAAGLNLIEVSFDGLTMETHDASRGRGTYERAVAALVHAKDAGIPRSAVVWTIHSGNLHELPGLPAFLESHDVRECYLSPFKKTGLNGAAAPWFPPQLEDLDRVKGAIGKWRAILPHLTITLLPECSCGRTSVVVGPEGDVRLCSFAYKSIGNLRRTPLLETWQGLEAELPESGPVGYCKLN